MDHALVFGRAAKRAGCDAGGGNLPKPPRADALNCFHHDTVMQQSAFISANNGANIRFAQRRNEKNLTLQGLSAGAIVLFHIFKLCIMCAAQSSGKLTVV